jgi:hypothetical protein
MQARSGHTVLGWCRLLPETLTEQEAVELSAVICERLNQRRIDAIVGKKLVNRDAIDAWCARLPDLLPEVAS